VKKLKKALLELLQMYTTNRGRGQANEKACNVLQTPQQKGDSVLVPQFWNWTYCWGLLQDISHQDKILRQDFYLILWRA